MLEWWVQRDRVNRALNAERQQSAPLDRHTSTEMRRLNSMISAFHQFHQPEQERPRQEQPEYLPKMLGRSL
jgi:hypothetical protein